MKWITHQTFAVGSSFMLGLEPAAILASWMFSTLPDVIDIFLAKVGFNFRKIHRGFSHAWILYCLIAFFLVSLPAFFAWKTVIWGFLWGVLSHILTDALTVMGVPVFLNPKRKIALKLVSTGTLSEVVFFILFIIVCAGFYLAQIRLGIARDAEPWFRLATGNITYFIQHILYEIQYFFRF